MIYEYPHKKSVYMIGVISDTHGLLRPEAIKALHGSDLILHAGDIGDTLIIKRLEEIAPVLTVRGNIDIAPSLFKYPQTQTVLVGNKKIFLIHNIGDLVLKPDDEFDLVIYGHSHKADIKEKRGKIYFNPGSAGKRRFNFPVTVGEIKIEEEKISTRIIKLTMD